MGRSGQERISRVKSIERQKKKVKTTGIDLPSKEISFQKWWDRVPFACYLLSTAGIITDVNQAGARILGYEQEEMVGRPIFSFILPEERVEAKKRFKQKLAGQPVPRVKDRIYLKKDGSKIYMARNDRIERDRQGEPVSICSTMVDITDYKKIEADLKATEERYKDLVEKAGIAILIDDRKGNVVYANKRYAEIFGYSIKEIKSFSIFSVVHPDDLKRVKSYHQGRFLGKKTPGRFDFKGIKKDGSIIYLEVVSTLIKRDKTAVGTQSYMWDITEQKKNRSSPAGERRVIPVNC